MKSGDTRTCLVCGTQFPAVKEFCPVCILREALHEQVKPAKSSFDSTVISRRGKPLSHQFDNYKLLTGKDGKPVELGRGAMGVTYKAFDVDLRCPVTLKVISEQYLGDESGAASFFARSPRCSKGAPFECRLGITPGQNRKALLLRDGVRRGRDP